MRSRLPTQSPNWFERAAAVALLRRIADNSPLSPAHTRLILGWMKLTNIRTRLKAQLPEGTPVAHKTGTSDVTNCITDATNIGRITLLDGRKLAITVVATDFTADCTFCDRVIARIAKALYVDAIHKHSHHVMLKAIKSRQPRSRAARDKMDKIDKADQLGKLDQHGYFGQRIAAIPAPTWLRTTAILWFVATIAVLLVGFRQALFIAPPDAELGNVQRIFYYHLPFAILGLVFPYVNLIASLAYLYLRHRNPLKALTADALAVASAQVTVLYVTLGLASGMLYGRPVWGIWWTWDARLTTYFILWLLYVSYLLTRKLAPSEQIAPLSSVLAIFAAVDIPIVFMSIRWWRTQHPSPIFAGGQNSGLDHSMYPAVLWNMAGWAMWGIFVLCFRFAIERRSQLAEQEYALQAIEASLHEYQG